MKKNKVIITTNVNVNVKRRLPLPAVNNNEQRICINEQHINNNKRNVSLQNYNNNNQQQQRCTLNNMNTISFEMKPINYYNTRNCNCNFNGNSTTKNEHEVQVHKSMMVSKHKESKSHVSDIDLALRFDLDRRVPTYVDQTNLNKTIQKFTLSNYNNKYNIYYKKRLFFPSMRSLNRTVKYKEWQKIFIQSLRDKQREEMELKYKMKQMRIIAKTKQRRKNE